MLKILNKFSKDGKINSRCNNFRKLSKLLNLFSAKNSVNTKIQNNKYILPNIEKTFKDKYSLSFISKV